MRTKCCKETFYFFCVSFSSNLPLLDLLRWAFIFVVVDCYNRSTIKTFERPFVPHFAITGVPRIFLCAVMWKSESVAQLIVCSCDWSSSTCSYPVTTCRFYESHRVWLIWLIIFFDPANIKMAVTGKRLGWIICPWLPGNYFCKTKNTRKGVNWYSSIKLCV